MVIGIWSIGFIIMKVPQHIVLFPDGNRRWAQKKGLPLIKGHREGYQNLIEFCEWCKKRGVKVLTAFGFSTENWARPKEEVRYLMKLFEEILSHRIKEYQKNNKNQEEGIRIRILGQKERLPKSLQRVIAGIENLTKDNKNLQLNLAVSYGGRWDIVQALRKIIRKKIPARNITEDLINDHLSTSGLPAPDLIIRAGKEQRLSNFVLWQAAYSEIYFPNKLWPDFTEKDLDKAIRIYSHRKRRFGE